MHDSQNKLFMKTRNTLANNLDPSGAISNNAAATCQISHVQDMLIVQDEESEGDEADAEFKYT